MAARGLLVHARLPNLPPFLFPRPRINSPQIKKNIGKIRLIRLNGVIQEQNQKNQWVTFT